jgi:hypothetical protein
VLVIVVVVVWARRRRAAKHQLSHVPTVNTTKPDNDARTYHNAAYDSIMVYESTDQAPEYEVPDDRSLSRANRKSQVGRPLPPAPGEQSLDYEAPVPVSQPAGSRQSRPAAAAASALPGQVDMVYDNVTSSDTDESTRNTIYDLATQSSDQDDVYHLSGRGTVRVRPK